MEGVQGILQVPGAAEVCEGNRRQNFRTVCGLPTSEAKEGNHHVGIYFLVYWIGGSVMTL